MTIKIRLEGNKIILSLNKSQAGIRIADEHGNHISRPTRTRNEERYFIEWMITNDEIKLLIDSLSREIDNLIRRMNEIRRFAEDSEYSQRRTIRVDRREIETFEGFQIFQYNETFNSFEKTLNSGLRVRITFKLGDFGVEPHPHMYVLVPFNFNSLEIKNREGDVNNGEELGSGCFGSLILNEEDLKEIILILSHASNKHRNALIEVLKS